MFNSLMQAACDIAFEYAHIRSAFGKKIGQFQVKYLHLDFIV